MIRVFIFGVIGVVLGTFLPVPIKSVSQQDEIKAVLSSDDALWRTEESVEMVLEELPDNGTDSLKSLIACQDLHSPKVSKVEDYEGYMVKWDSDTPPILQPNVVEAVLVEALSYCGEEAQLIDIDCTERPCVSVMAIPSTISCPWLQQGSPFDGLVELTNANLEWWPGKSEGFAKESVDAEMIMSVFIRSYDESELWEKYPKDSATPWLRKNPASDSDWAQNVLQRALLREEMFIDAIGDDILSEVDAE